MKRNLSAHEICQIIEREIPGTRCTVSPAIDQIAVQFEERPEIVIHILTPYYQQQLKRKGIPEENISKLISDVRNIAEHRAYADTIIEDINSFLSENEKDIDY